MWVISQGARDMMMNKTCSLFLLSFHLDGEDSYKERNKKYTVVSGN